MLDTESLSTLLKYGGVKPTASNKAILESIAPISDRESDDVAKTNSVEINLSNPYQAVLSDGSTVRILPIADNDTQVIVYGRLHFRVDIKSFQKYSYGR